MLSVPDPVSGRGALRLRPVSRTARGDLRSRRDPPRRLAGTHRLPAAQSVALPGVPAHRRRAPDRTDIGIHATGPGGPTGRRAGHARALREGRLRQSSDVVVQGPRRARRGDACLRARVQRPGMRVDRQPRQQRGRPRRAAGPRLLRLHPADPRARKDPRVRRQRPPRSRHRRQLRRRQPSLHAGGRALRLGVRQHQPAGVLRGGGQDVRVRDRRAARLAVPASRRLSRRRRHAPPAHRPRLRRPSRRRSGGR